MGKYEYNKPGQIAKLVAKIKESPINYFSDLFITAMVVLWIADNVYQSIIATILTISSIVLSHKTNSSCYDTSMWSSIGTNVAIPLSCGGAIWMIKNSVQHAISNYRGKLAHQDFPAVHPECEYDEIEIEEKISDLSLGKDENDD